jgi:hypothetical protein
VNEDYKYEFFANWNAVFRSIACNLNKKNDNLSKPTQYPHFSSLKLQEIIFNILTSSINFSTLNNVITSIMHKRVMEIIDSIAMLLFMNNEDFFILQQLSYLANRKYN